MMRGGAHMRYLQELLGHTKIDTTQIYNHVCPLDLKEAHQGIGDAFKIST